MTINIRKYLETQLSIIKYNLSEFKRYSNLLHIILKIKPKKILEIGIYKGLRSLEMIKAAKSFNPLIKFYGFDLFEMFFDKKNILSKELSKRPKSMEIIKDLLKEHAKIKLIKGNTLKTLPKFSKKNKVDFIFIDGGHSVKTINNDWNQSKKLMHKNTVVVFDDFYSGDKNLIKKFGCNKIIENLSNDYLVEYLEPKDYIHQLKVHVQLVKITLKK
jgi:predicted O-methyltransferase YrrM